MVCDPGGDHARFDRVVVEQIRHTAAASRTTDTSPLADKPRDGRSDELPLVGTDGHWNEKLTPSAYVLIGEPLGVAPGSVAHFLAASRIASSISVSTRDRKPGTALITSPPYKDLTLPLPDATPRSASASHWRRTKNETKTRCA